MEVLPDVLKSGLRVVLCGTAVANKSTNDMVYYAIPDDFIKWKAG
jgi:G:T/U-mismatch repair DNA glycosylase